MESQVILVGDTFANKQGLSGETQMLKNPQRGAGEEVWENKECGQVVTKQNT